MNQILFIQEKNRISLKDTKKIVLFFAVSIIVFGLIIIIQGALGVHSVNEMKTSAIKNAGKTQIELVQTDDGNVQITVNSQVAISEVMYYWNSEASQTLPQENRGRMNIQEMVTIPAGENVLTVKTIDVNGGEAIKTQTFTLNVDKPVINLMVGGTTLNIIVESKVDLSYVTYKWNSEQEQKIDMLTFQDKAKFEKEIEIPKGQNKLLITAVDIYGNKSEKSQEVKGVPVTIKPVIQGKYIFFEATADESIKQVEFQFNGQNYIIGSDVIKGQKRVTYRIELQQGWNYLKITVTTSSGVKSNPQVWKYEYKPQ